MQLFITNLSAADLYLPYLEKSVAAKATVVFSCAQSDLSKMVDLQEAVTNGIAEYQVVPNAMEVASGILAKGIPLAERNAAGLAPAMNSGTGQYRDTETEVWFGPPLLAEDGVHPNVSFVAVAPAGVNPAACSFANFLNANNSAYGVFGAFTAGKKVLIQSGANKGVWTINANLTSLTRDATFSVVQGQYIFCVESATAGANYLDVPVYQQTAATGAGAPVFSLESVIPNLDGAALNTLLASEIAQFATTGILRDIRFIPSAAPYFIERAIQIDPGDGIRKWNIGRGCAGATLVMLMAGKQGAPTPCGFTFNYARTATTTVAIAAVAGAKKVTIAATIAKGKYIAIGGNPTHTSVHKVLDVAVNEENFDLTLDTELLESYAVGIAVDIMNSHAEGCTLDFEHATISGTCSRYFELPAARYCVCQATFSDVKWGIAPACDLGSWDLGGVNNYARIVSHTSDGSNHAWFHESNFRTEIEMTATGGGCIADDSSIDLLITNPQIVLPPGQGQCIGCVNSQGGFCERMRTLGGHLTGGIYGFIGMLSGVGTDVRNPAFDGTVFSSQSGASIATACTGLKLMNVRILNDPAYTAYGIEIEGGSVYGTNLVISSIKKGVVTNTSFVGVNLAPGAAAVLVQIAGLETRDCQTSIAAAGTNAVLQISDLNVDGTTSTNNGGQLIQFDAGVTATIDKASIKAPAYKTVMAAANAANVTLSRYVTSGGALECRDNYGGGTAAKVSYGPGCVFGATAFTDDATRPIFKVQSAGGVASKAVTAADVTLTSADMFCPSVETTGALTAGRAVIDKFVAPGLERTFSNGNTGAFATTFKASPSDPGFIVAQGKSARGRVNSDGAMVRVTADL